MRLLFKLIVPVVAVGFLLFCLLVFHSDRTVRARFATARWVQPAQVFAAPLELHRGAPIAQNDLVSALERLGYRQVQRSPERSGEYQSHGNRTLVFRRAFTVAEDQEPQRLLQVEHSSRALSRLSDAGDQDLIIDRLEPEPIGSLYPSEGEDRLMLRLDDWPEILAEGLVAVEDQRYYQHFGVDPLGLLRALLRNLAAGRVVEGGSTLTQQLVKNLFLSNERSLPRKAREAVMAVLLEWHFSKSALLEAYGNEVYLGQDGNRAIHGFGLASQFWFGKPLAELQAEEVALLVGMVKGPSAYQPERHPKAAKRRRDLVLGVWLQAGLLSAAEHEAAISRELGISARGRQRRTTTAFLDLVRRELVRDFPEEALTYAGLQIHTSLDPLLQALAENLVRKTIPDLEVRTGAGLQAALVATGVADGRIRALVGSAQPGNAGFNRALDARRPIGSLIKPAVYYTALARPQEYNLVTQLDDSPLQMQLPNGDVWSPENYDGEDHGLVPLWQALARSYNLATVRLAMDIGLPEIALTLQDLGLQRPIPVVPALALGAIDLSPLEVAGVYNTLGSGGYPSPLRAIAGVYTDAGAPLLRNELTVKRGLDPRSSYLLTWALQRTLIDGTGRGVSRHVTAERALAGKTGTSDQQRDAWFAGFGNDLQATVWVGFDDNRPTRLTGASGALPIWAQFMEGAQARSIRPRRPRGVEIHSVDAESSLPAEGGCRTLLSIPFIEGSVPREKAPCANSQHVPWYRFWQ